MIHIPVRAKVTNTKHYLNELDKVLAQRRLREKQQLYVQGQELFTIVKQFILKNNCMIYGGVALNSILPPKDQFYGKMEIPDIDFFSQNAKQQAFQLADLIKSKGFNYVEVRSGVHYETYKVYVNFIPLVDITEVPRRLFHRMSNMAKKEKYIIRRYVPKFDLPIAPLAFLRLSMHMELSRPEGYIERWVKVYKRMTLLYDYYPIPLDRKCEGFKQHGSSRVLALKPFIMRYIKEVKIPMIGAEAIKMYLNAGGRKIHVNSVLDENMSLLDVVSVSYLEHVEKLKEILDSLLVPGEQLILQHHAPLNKSELLTKNCLLVLVTKTCKYPLIGFYQSQSCISYKSYRGYMLASIDTLLSFMYAWLLADRSYLNDKKLECVLSWLLHIQYIYLDKKKKLFHMFEQSCYGTQQQLVNVKKQMWDKGRDKIIYRPTTNI